MPQSCSQLAQRRILWEAGEETLEASANNHYIHHTHWMTPAYRGKTPQVDTDLYELYRATTLTLKFFGQIQSTGDGGASC